MPLFVVVVSLGRLGSGEADGSAGEILKSQSLRSQSSECASQNGNEERRCKMIKLPTRFNLLHRISRLMHQRRTRMPRLDLLPEDRNHFVAVLVQQRVLQCPIVHRLENLCGEGAYVVEIWTPSVNHGGSSLLNGLEEVKGWEITECD